MCTINPERDDENLIKPSLIGHRDALLMLIRVFWYLARRKNILFLPMRKETKDI